MRTHKNFRKSRELIDTYQKEQLEYIQGQINEIKKLVDDRQS